MDALLGIGTAGGGASRDEGRALASRLTEMRRERSERARVTGATKKAQGPPPPGPAGQMTLQGLDEMGDDIIFDPTNDEMGGEMQLITPGGGGGRKSNKSKNKRKKRKKKGKR